MKMFDFLQDVAEHIVYKFYLTIYLGRVERTSESLRYKTSVQAMVPLISMATKIEWRSRHLFVERIRPDVVVTVQIISEGQLSMQFLDTGYIPLSDDKTSRRELMIYNVKHTLGDGIEGILKLYNIQLHTLYILSYLHAG